MTDDGGLRSIFRNKIPSFQWTSIESGITGGGIPDSEFCSPDGVQAWIEYKATDIYYVQIKSLQVAWIMRRVRYGGNAWVAVRRTPKSKKESGVDELWLMWGDQAEDLYYHGLTGIHALCWSGGPGNWNFNEVRRVLTTRTLAQRGIPANGVV